MSRSLVASPPTGRLPQPLYLVEEVSHRVMNEYAEAIADLSLASMRTASAQAREALDRAADRLRTHAEAHRALLSPADGGRIELSEHLARVCSAMCRALLEERRVRLVAELDEIWMDSARCWRVGLIVAELIRNAARHGLADKPGCIRVKLQRVAGALRCQVSDNGGARAPTRPGRGQRLIEALVGELGGAVRWRFGPSGCNAEVVCPAD